MTCSSSSARPGSRRRPTCWPARPVRRAASCPASRCRRQAEWFLPRGQGLDQLVIATYERASAVGRAAVRAGPGRVAAVRGRSRRSRRRLCCSAGYGWTSNGCPASPTGRCRRRPNGRTRVRVDPTAAVEQPQPGREPSRRSPSSTASPAALRRWPACAAPCGRGRSPAPLRWTRNADGVITSVLVAVVATGRLVPGEQLGSLPGPAVAYISVPVTTPPGAAAGSGVALRSGRRHRPAERAAPAATGQDHRPARVVPDPRRDGDDPAVRVRPARRAAGPGDLGS